MKKTLAIVLALVMVLCMIPAMSAESTTTMDITNKNYRIEIKSYGVKEGTPESNSADKVNSITLAYDFENQTAVTVDKWAADAKMALVKVIGFNENIPDDAVVTIDGKKLTANTTLGTGFVGGVNAALTFPVELTKAGYTDTYLIQITGTKGGVTYTETAKISVKLVNNAAYKDAKSAVITDIAAKDANQVDAYIVGTKIYLDFVGAREKAYVDVTFGDENGKAFKEITYANQVSSANGNVYLKGDNTKDATAKLVASATAITFNVATAEDSKVVFNLETKNYLYETKAYSVVVRENIVEADPKGIYFAEPTKTIAVGESFKPVVMGVATDKRVDANILVGTSADKQIIDVTDAKNVIGTREGVAYITATYSPKGSDKTYKSSSMKVVVTAGPSIPPVVKTEIYYVTCRNLNVRKGAGTSYAKAGMIHRGDAVEVVEIVGGWAKLANGTYVCAKYITKK